MKKLIKLKIKNILVVPITCICILNFNATSIFAQQTYYQKNTSEVIGKDVTYTKSQRVTDKGMLDVYVVTAPIGDEYIKIKPAMSTVDYRKKEPTTTILNENDAIAGVNADFFNMTGSYSDVTGPIVQDGNIIALDAIENIEKNEYASFVIDENGVPTIQYLHTQIHFLNNGSENIHIYQYNKFNTLEYYTYIDTNAMTNTQPIDDKFKNVTKIVVEDGYVTYVSSPGEVVQVPSNGYVILVPEQSAEYAKSAIHVGDTAEINITSDVDFETVETAVGGGGMILVDGQIAEDDGFVPSGYQPRTAIGINQEGTEAILMVVDGRSHSVGATQNDMAQLMLENGAYNAMQFDGGGSTTMGVKTLDSDSVEVVNTVSEGTQRPVSNTVGVYNEAPVGELNSVYIKSKADKVFMGTGVPLYTVGIDEYYNEVPLGENEIQTTVIKGEGEIINDVFYPTSTGEVVVQASIGDKSTTKTMQSMEIAELYPNTKSINAGVGGKTPLSFTGKSTGGDIAYIYTGVEYEVYPPELGVVENDVFIAQNTGSGYIKASVGDVVCYIDVNVGYETKQVTSFEEQPAVSFTSYPEYVTGSVSYTNDPENVYDQNTALQLTYQFEHSTDTQAAYIQFDNPIIFNEGVTSFHVWVKGDGSNNWLRVRLVDANGNIANVDLTKSISFNEYTQLNATIPSDLVYPVKLDRIYVTTVGGDDNSEHTLYFDDLTVDQYNKYESVNHPSDSKYYDVKQQPIQANSSSSTTVTLLGDLNANGKNIQANYSNDVNKAISAAKENSDKVIFAGDSGTHGDIGMSSYTYQPAYKVIDNGSYAIVQMTAKNGGFVNTDITQWAHFSNDIKNIPTDNIIILMDKNPLNFTTQEEEDLFSVALEDLAKEGKNIFVVSTEGTKTTVETKNDIRYINLGSLYNSDGTINKDFSVLQLNITEDNITYDLKKVF